jgi:two-component system, chemotaxis family, protein-glutamate methylesterase/glutaminase
VLVVDDSAIIRGLITRWLDADPLIQVVATASNGAIALRQVIETKPELVILDIEMPIMDGMTALPKILEADPDIKIIMSSTLTRRNAEISLLALERGAADYIPKPETTREVNASVPFKQEITEKVKALGAILRKTRGQPVAKASGLAGQTVSVMPVKANAWARPSGTALSLRKASPVKPRILAIGSSTGGPQALLHVLSEIMASVDVPVIITQHMPATFTAILAEHLARATGRPCAEARDGDVLNNNAMFIAPGNFHMIVERSQNKFVLRLNQEPQENFCRPAVDPMFRSVAKCFGPAALGVILTGMGQDGLKGSTELVNNGGTVIAQDEESSVVWGMPGAVSLAGLCAAVVPLNNMGKTIMKLLDGGAA